MTQAIKIDPECWYDDRVLATSLGVTYASLAAARKAKALRFSRTGNRNLMKGEWVLAWLEADRPDRAKRGSRTPAPARQNAGAA